LIPAAFVRDLRDRVDIVDLIGTQVQLRRAGRSFVGLCPFHPEKTPSFNVNRERQMYHCFGCGAGGDALGFLMAIEGLSFVEAVRELATRCGIEVPEERGHAPRADAEAEEARRARWRAALEDAHAFFGRMLHDDPAGAPARDYLRDRGVSVELARTFGLGFAPPAWDALLVHLQRRHHSPEDLEAMGLAVARSGGSGWYDRFRGRLVFPVQDPRGRVIAFSGRILPAFETSGEREEAKYINSPETPLYRKGRSFLGLPQARAVLRASGEIVLVEGNFDLLAVHALGRPGVLAPLGTALTPEQVELLRRFGARTVTLLLDPDPAGVQAARRAFPVLAAAGLAVRWARLPAGRDPGSLLPAGDRDVLLAALDEAPAFPDRVIREAAAAAGESTAGRAAAARETGVFLAAIADPAERDLYVRQAAAALGIEKHLLHRLVAEAPAPESERPAAARAEEAPSEPVPEGEADFLVAVLADPALLRESDATRLEPWFTHPGARAMLRELAALRAEGAAGNPSTADRLVAAVAEPHRAWARSLLFVAADLEPARAGERHDRALRALEVRAQRREAGPQGDRVRAAQAAGDDRRSPLLVQEKIRSKQRVTRVVFGQESKR
jgi:DNA primase